MSRLPLTSLAAAAVLGQLVGLLGWIDALFFPLLLAFPLVTGAVAASRGLRAAWPAVLWLSAGVNMLWTDWVVNREDVAFHAGVAVFTALLSLAGWGAVALATRSRRREPAGVRRPA
jgi:hypothetical protein